MSRLSPNGEPQAPERKESDMGKVVHFEIPTDDIARAKEFYGSIFGWQLQDMQGEAMGLYTLAMTTPVDEKTQAPTEPGAINGGLMKRVADTPSPVITIEVDGIDDALKKIEAGGGNTVQARTEMPGMGAFAYFKDSEGNVMGLWETI
jgi:predicted enzyme related to lactoylglutathione lyase